MGFIVAGHQRATKVENTKWWWWWSFTSSLLILSSQIECTHVLSSSVYVNVFSFQVACNHCSPICFLDHIHDTTSKSCRNIKPKILNKPWVFVRILRQGFKVCSRSKLIFQICTKLLSTCLSSPTSTTVTTSTSFELPSSHARVTLIKFTKQEWVSESVS